MLTHEIARLEAKGRPAPLLDDDRHRWLYELFHGLGQGWSDAARNHPRHGTTVSALLQLATALTVAGEDQRRTCLLAARQYLDEAIADKPPAHHLREAAEAVDAVTARLIASIQASRDGGCPAACLSGDLEAAKQEPR